MDLSDLLDLIFTEEDELRRMGAAGGPEARKLVEEAVEATKKARVEAEEAFGKIFDRAGLARKTDVDALAARLEALAAKVEALAKAVDSIPRA
jgi:polyhydroxyalkanoate synthesis regulator phasin